MINLQRFQTDTILPLHDQHAYMMIWTMTT